MAGTGSVGVSSAGARERHRLVAVAGGVRCLWWPGKLRGRPGGGPCGGRRAAQVAVYHGRNPLGSHRVRLSAWRLRASGTWQRPGVMQGLGAVKLTVGRGKEGL